MFRLWVVVSFCLLGCGAESPSGGGGGGGGGADAGGGGGGGGGGGTRQWCGQPAFSNPSGNASAECFAAACCAQMNACADNQACVACGNASQPGPECEQNAAFVALLTCLAPVVSTCSPGGGGGGGGGGLLCRPRDAVCTPLSGQCCVGDVCCERTSPPSCQSAAACNL